MSDDDKQAEYKRITGVKKTYVHETAYKDGLIREARKRSYRRPSKRFVKRQGDPPNNKGKVVTVTQTQHDAYTVISTVLKTSDNDKIPYKAVRDVGIRDATLKALEKAELIYISNNEISMWERHLTPEEKMLRDGVGRIQIIIGI